MMTRLILISGLLVGYGLRAQEPPTIVTQPVNRTNVMGTPAAFAVEALGTEPLYYQWFFNRTNPVEHGTNAALDLPFVQPAQAGLYHATITNTAGAATSTPALLVVRQPPRIVRQPADVLTTPGSTVTFSVVATGDLPISYIWYHDLLFTVKGATSDTLTLTNVQIADAGTYQVSLENEFGAFNSIEAMLAVEVPPSIVTQPASLVVTQGQSAMFAAGVSGDPPLHFQWYFNETNQLNGATNSTLLLPEVEPVQAGSYLMRVTNRVGAAASMSAFLQVRVGPHLVGNPTNVNAVVGSTATFQVTAEGDPPLFYQWFWNETNALPDATNAALVLENVQPIQAGLYSVGVSNAVGRVLSAGAVLAILIPPQITQQPVSLVVTQGAPAQFTVTSIGSEPLVYQWFLHATTALAQATQPTLNLPSAQPLDAGDYTVRIANPAGAVTSEVATLTVRIPPAILQQPGDQIAAPGGTALFSVSALGDMPLLYQWFYNVTNLLSGSTGATLNVTNVGAANIGSYSVLISNTVGAARSREAALVIKMPPTIVIPPASLVVTQGAPATFRVTPGGDGPFSYQWFFNETNPIPGAFGSLYTIPLTQSPNAGTYSVEVSNDAGSIRSASATLSVRVPPMIVQQPRAVTAAPGADVLFTVGAIGDPPRSYQWFFNNTNQLLNETNASLALTNVQLSSDGNYSVLVSNSVGTTLSAAVPLRIRRPPIITQPPLSQAVTQGQSALFTVQIGGDGPFSYQWFFSTNPIAGARASTLSLSNVQAPQGGAYSVRVTNLVGFAISSDALLTVRLLPAITEQPLSQALRPDSTAVFHVQVIGDPPFSYQWFFNGSTALTGQTSDTLTLAHVQANESGSYSVAVTNPVGVVFSSNAQLSVILPPAIAEQPSSLVTTQGWPALFRVVAGGDAPFSYQWFFNDTNSITGATNDSLLLPAVQLSDAGAYAVLVSNPVGSIQSQKANLAIRLLPLLVEQPSSQTATQSQSLILHVQATSESPISYQWRWHGTNLADAVVPTLAFDHISPDRAGPYDVILANDWGAVTSAVAVLTVLGLDFGDAPEPAYPTLLANNGARHVLLPGVYLGTGVNAEPDGQPDANAAGDNSLASEEDGVVFQGTLYPGQPASVLVVASTNGLLNAWIDFDGVNAWGQAGEQILTNRALVAGTNEVPFLVPPTAMAGTTFARFRFSTVPGLGFGGTLGGQIPDGEVEDYAVSIVPAANLALAPSAAAIRVNAGANATLTLAVTNFGPSTATAVVLSNVLSSRSTFVSATASQGSCNHTNDMVLCSLGSLAAGQRAVITITARIGLGTNTTRTTVFANEFDPLPANNTALRALVGTITLPGLANPDTILLPLEQEGPGSVYPANIFVSGVTDSVFKVTVGVRGINHDFPDDIDILLVGPGGQKVLLMSDCGLNNALVDVSLTFDDDATQALPDSDLITSGTYRPTNFGTRSDAFPTPAPLAPYLTNLSVFRGTNPNGTWSLYVMDDQPENATPQSAPGYIADGWDLNIVTADPMADLSITQSADPNPVLVGSVLTYSLLISNRGPGAATATVMDLLPPEVSFVSALSSRGLCAEQDGLVSCTLSNLFSGASATVDIQVVAVHSGNPTNLV
ncbi:MAG TPA: immunoglobulin domain-containing protein, partial [Verrucomicrobiae bacterium]|nr:immunoglobulin domain-containing protein [Verrucomicrobiae bacterium]